MTLIEIDAGRRRINKEWDKLDRPAADLLTTATIELQHRVLHAIEAGEVDRVAAANALPKRPSVNQGGRI